MITLESLGWNNFFINEFNEYNNRGFIPGRISVEHKERYNVYTVHGEINAEVSGRFIYTADNPSAFPKTGDWVAGTYFPDEQKMIIHEVLERKTKFSRNAAGRKTEEQVIVTNIDYLFIVQSMDNDFSPRRIERYLSSALQGKIKPVIILSKKDLCSDSDIKIKEAEKVAGEIPVFSVSAVTTDGIENIKQFIKEGITIAFVGSSGVGKSTLINILAGEELQKTNEIREWDSKGRHTTTRRELILLPGGGILIDTPGMREFQMWDSDDGLEVVFDEIEELVQQCRFTDCTHTKEKGCAVLDALQTGNISEERYLSYLKLQKELRYLEKKNDIYSEIEEKRKWKTIHKEMKNFYKKNPGKN